MNISLQDSGRFSVVRVDNPASLSHLLDGGLVPASNAGRMDGLRKQWSNIHHGSQWGDIASLSDAQALFSAGWDAGAIRARSEVASMPLADLVPQALVMRRRRVYRDSGDTLRIESAMAGDWERAFDTRSKRASSGPVALSVCCAFGGAGAVGHEEFFWTGVQMLVLTDILEGQGWRVELRAVKANDMKDNHCHIQDITVKLADQPVRDDAVMALFGHAGVYRVYGWAGNVHSSRKVPFGMGQVLTGAELSNAIAGAADVGLIHPASLIVPQAYDRTTAIGNIRAALASVRGMAGAA